MLKAKEESEEKAAAAAAVGLPPTPAAGTASRSKAAIAKDLMACQQTWKQLKAAIEVAAPEDQPKLAVSYIIINISYIFQTVTECFSHITIFFLPNDHVNVASA